MRRFTDEKIMETILKPTETPASTERLAYSIQESAEMLGVNYFSVYRLIQRGKLKVCRALRGKLLVLRSAVPNRICILARYQRPSADRTSCCCKNNGWKV